MNHHAILYDADGVVIGQVFCSNPDDLPRQPHARMLAVPPDHAVMRNPPASWARWRVLAGKLARVADDPPPGAITLPLPTDDRRGGRDESR